MIDKFRKIIHKLLKNFIVGLLITVFFLVTVACDINMFSKNKEPKEPLVKEGVCLKGENVGGLKRSEVLEKIREHATKINVDAINAGINKSTWKITEEKPGLKVNMEKTLENILNAEQGQEIEPVVEKTYPNITTKVLQGNIVKIAEYATPIVDKSPSRMNNIELAAGKINNIILSTSEEFSFNRVVGRRTEDKGYEYAPIIIRTEEGPKKGDGVGGGVCQLSTTMFNAVEECGLEVTERHTHSSEVTYVPEGEDAAVSDGSIDFKFKNTRQYPIMLKVYVESNTLVVKILENRN